MEEIVGCIHSIVFCDYDVEGEEFVEVRVRVFPQDISIIELDELRNKGVIHSYVIEERNSRGKSYRELRIRLDPITVKGLFKERELVIDLYPIEKELSALLIIGGSLL